MAATARASALATEVMIVGPGTTGRMLACDPQRRASQEYHFPIFSDFAAGPLARLSVDAWSHQNRGVDSKEEEEGQTP